MIKSKEEKIASTVHLNRSQIEAIDRLARRTSQSRAYVLRELVDTALSSLQPEEVSGSSMEKKKEVALNRLLRMGEGYGESAKDTIKTLDQELYEEDD